MADKDRKASSVTSDPEVWISLALSQHMAAAHLVTLIRPGEDEGKAVIFIASPLYTLVGFSIELSLKAFLASKDVGVDDLRFVYGHDLKKLLAHCRRRGLEIDHIDGFDKVFANIARIHKGFLARYPKLEAFDVSLPTAAVRVSGIVNSTVATAIKATQ